MDGSPGGREYGAAINGAQRLQARGGGRNQTILAGFLGLPQQNPEKFGREIGHIAGDDQVPLGLRFEKSGVNASERSCSFDGIGDDGEPERLIPIWRTDQRRASRSLAHISGNLLHKSFFPGWQQRFIAAHAAAAPARQHKTCRSRNNVRDHEMILTSICRCRRKWHIAFGNKSVYICFILAIVMLAASPMRAADDAGALSGAANRPAAPKTSERRVFVVRADPHTAKLRRIAIVSTPAKKANAKTPAIPPAISQIVDQSARAHDVDPLLVRSMIQVESNYNPYAVSPKGAEGLMQLMPPTARMLGVSNTFDPGQNIEAGVKYLKYLQDLYKDDRLALAAYNAGPGAVDKYKWIPPYAETQSYVEKVGKRYGEAREAAARSVAPPPAQADQARMVVGAVPAEESHPKLEQFVDENGRLHLRTTQ